MKNQTIKNFIGIFSLVVFLGSAHVVSATYPDWDYQASYRVKPSAFTVLSLTADQIGNTSGNTQTSGYNPYAYGTNSGTTTTTTSNGYQTQTVGYNANGQPIVNNYYYTNPSTSTTKVATSTTTKSTSSNASSTKSNVASNSSTANNAKLASASVFNSPTNNPGAYTGLNNGTASGFSNGSNSNGFASGSNSRLTAMSLNGSGSFMPSSVWQWILVILLILIIIVIIRVISRKDETHVVHH